MFRTCQHAQVLEVDALAAAHIEDAAGDAAKQGALGVAQLGVHTGGAAAASNRRHHLQGRRAAAAAPLTLELSTKNYSSILKIA